MIESIPDWAALTWGGSIESLIEHDKFQENCLFGASISKTIMRGKLKPDLHHHGQHSRYN